MNNIKLSILPVLALSILSTALAGEARMEKAGWPYIAKIEVEDAPGGGVAEFSITPEIFDLAAEDLSDLRVVTGAGEETAYVLRIAEGKDQEVPIPVKLFNETCLPGRQSSVTADFGGKVMKNRLEIMTPGLNFRRPVLVEGSDDGVGWQKVKGGALLFRVAGGKGAGESFDRSVVDLPENDQRYLRITVYNGQDDPEHVDIQKVTATRFVRQPPETVEVPIKGGKAFNKKSVTEISIDTGFRNLPFYELVLHFADENFYRRVNVSGRNEETGVMKTAMEGGAEKKKTVRVPWTHVTSLVIYRFTSGGDTDESTTINLSGAGYRYLKVMIENVDDKPLRFEGADVKRLACYIDFKREQGESYTLYFGNDDARRPSYDIVHYIDRLREGGVTQAKLGAPAANPDRGGPEQKIPLSEKHKWLIWAALLAALAVLILLVYRMAGRYPGKDEDRGTKTGD